MMTPYREAPPVPKLPPRTSWHRIVWALCRGAFRRIARRAEQQRALRRSFEGHASAPDRWLWRREWAHENSLRGWARVDYQFNRGLARAILRMEAVDAAERLAMQRK